MEPCDGVENLIEADVISCCLTAVLKNMYVVSPYSFAQRGLEGAGIDGWRTRLFGPRQ